MANTIEYADSPNVDTAFVVQQGGQKNRAVLTAPQDTTTLELPDNPNSTKGYVTIDGKKHKVILVADISGNGGGGGGAVDSVNGKTGVVVLDATDVGAVPQYETMPTADASNADLIVQFVGATDTYTNGYFYKCTETYTDPSATISQAAGSGLTDLSVDVDLFVAEEQPSGDTIVNFIYSAITEALSPTTFTYSTMSLSVDSATFLEKLHEMYTGDYSVLKRITLGFNGTSWTVAGWTAGGVSIFVWDDITPSGIDIAWGVIVTGTAVATPSSDEFSMTYTANSNTWTKAGVPVDIAEYGITYSGTPVVDDVLSVVYTAPAISGHAWTRIDVQPQPVIPDPLPSQTGNNGKFLSTNGTTASWETISALQNTATGTNALTILGTATNGIDNVNIGQYSAINSGTDSTAVGCATVIAGNYAVACGHASEVSSDGGIAIGDHAYVAADYAIQLGGNPYSTRTNSDANTFKVGNNNGNFEMMDANGNLPADRIADTTGLTAGNYLPRLTIDAQGNKTITWVAE